MRTPRDETGSGDLIAFIFFVVTSILFITLILLMGLSTRQAITPTANRMVDAYAEKYARYGMRVLPSETLTVDAQLKAALLATGRLGAAENMTVTCGRYLPDANNGAGQIIPSAPNQSTTPDPDSVVRAGDLVACEASGTVPSWALSRGDLVGGDYYFIAVKTATIGDQDYVG